MSQYKAYPAYKDSGVEWIGQVPEHWEATKLKYVAEFSGGGTPPKENPDYWNGSIPWISPKDMKYEVVTDSIDHITTEGLENSATKLIDSGSVLLVTRSGILRHTIPVGINNVPVSLNQDMKALSLNQIRVRPRFILRWVQGFNRSLLGVWAKEGATVESLEHEYVADTPLPLPDLVEQDAILSTLDCETARIDALIGKKTRFIELLKEKRQALITHAVTKGLDPNVKMKDSGIEWIGQVPEHWEVKPFFALVTELNRKNVGLVETNILSLSYGNIIQKPETRNMGLTPESYETYQIVESGEIVFRFTDLQNDKRSLRSAQVTQRGIITSAYMAVKPQSIDSTYFAWLMRSYDLCKVFYAMGGGLRQSLKFEDVRRLPVLIPPVDEQSAITNTINAGTARIDALVEKTEQSITLLKERRAAFITAAVTGQIDLRGEQ